MRARLILAMAALAALALAANASAATKSKGSFTTLPTARPWDSTSRELRS
jgi:hypothetical protein